MSNEDRVGCCTSCLGVSPSKTSVISFVIEGGRASECGLRAASVSLEMSAVVMPSSVKSEDSISSTSSNSITPRSLSACSKLHIYVCVCVVGRGSDPNRHTHVDAVTTRSIA